MPKDFMLQVYTWPACTGVDPEVRETGHDTAEEAIAHLEAVSQPYAYAVLYRYEDHTWKPCDWTGRVMRRGRGWPVRFGAHGDHPAVERLRRDWDRLVKIVASVQQETGEGTVPIARRVLARHHPEVQGWETRLGEDAVDLYLARTQPRRTLAWS